MASYDDTATVSGSVVSIENGADEVGAKSCVVTVHPTLSGKSEVTETQTGRNLWEFGDVDIDTSQAYVMKYFTYPIPAGTYNLSADITSTTTRCQIRFRKEDGSAITQITLDANNGRVNASFTLTEPAYRAYVYSAMQTSGYMTSWEDVQLEFGSTAHAYEPYQTPTQYTAHLGRTIYGGSADLMTGEGVDGYGNIDMGTLNWQYDSTYTRFFTVGLTDVIKRGTSGWITDLAVSSPYTVASGTANDKTISEYASTGYVYIKDTDYTDPTAFKTSLSGKYLTYPLATPTDFTFDGQEVSTRLGYNAFWSEQGNTELTYYKSGYGFTSVTVHKETPEGEPVEVTRKLHRIIYEGQVDVISGTGLIYIGESGTQYDPPETFNFQPIIMKTDEGENTLFANEGASAITYRKDTE